jgi:DNA (cytosine-5)-methyltransferase 1
MRYGSVCTGIKAEGVAWAPLGWTPVFNSEIDRRPRAVLEHRWPEVPNLGDFTTIESTPGPIDLLMGGTPCQDFSVAGLRAGLGGDRGNLTLEFLRLAGRLRPEWLVWENVPGVLSVDGGRAFGAFLGGLVQLGYGFAWRVLDAQYIRVDGYARAVPQRRRRVFVVGRAGDWRSPVAVLLEREGMSGHPAPRRSPGQGVAGTLTGSLGSTGADARDALNGHLIAFGGKNCSEPIDLATAVRTNDRLDFKSETFVASFNWQAAGRQTSLGFDDSGAANTLSTCTKPAIAFQERGRKDGRTLEYQEDVVYSLNAISGGSRTNENNIAYGWSVRRLMPVECERLQGFPTSTERVVLQCSFDRPNGCVHVEPRCLRRLNSALLVAGGESDELALSADIRLWNDQASRGALVAVHVRQSSEPTVAAIRSRGRFLWCASGAGEPGWFLPQSPVAGFARQVALTTRSLAKEAQSGKGGARPNIRRFTVPAPGALLAAMSGLGSEADVSDAARSLDGAITSTMSGRGLGGPPSGWNEQTWLYSALSATASCIPPGTQPVSSFTVILDLESDYTAVPYRGAEMSDGPRYFCLGNSIAVNCLRWIGLRIELVRRITGAQS